MAEKPTTFEEIRLAAVAAVHREICEDSPEECAQYGGKCIRAVDGVDEVGLLLPAAAVPSGDRPDADRAPVDKVTAPFETIMQVYFDGMGTGVASTLGRFRPDAPNEAVEKMTQHVIDITLADPIAVEQLAEKVRQRLRGEGDEHIEEVRVYGSDSAGGGRG